MPEAGILSQLPRVDEAAVDAALARELAANSDKLVVLDDDPTGVQTVHDVSVYTDWSETSIREGFEEDGRLFYILTNSRAMTAAESERVHREIGDTLMRVSRETGRGFMLLSRCDSTLRGHYPLETQVLRERLEAAGHAVDGEVLCPFFKEGGRFTLGGVHYVQQGDELVPAAQTEFAADRTFGYSSSDLPGYIEEKTRGEYPASGVTLIPIEQLRACDYEGITQKLLAVHDFGKVCVDAADYCDVKVFSVALYRAAAQGRSFIFRTAASLVKALGGVSDRPLLRREEMITRPGGGIVVVGSHTHKTTEQLEHLLELEGVRAVEFDSDLVLEGDAAFGAEIDRCVAEAERLISSGLTAVCYTKRKLLELPGDTKEGALMRSVKISDGVQSLVARLGVTPAFVVAKGGITSSDVGTKALAVRRARVLGQIQPGVPVWLTGPESRFPNTPYVIFPGNTGGPDTLRLAVETLTHHEK